MAEGQNCMPGKEGRDSECRTRRYSLAISLIGFSFFASFLMNSLFPWVNPEIGKWIECSLIPALPQFGLDFREGISRPANMLVRGLSPYDMGNWYPPFVALAAVPLTLLSEDNAYWVQFFSLPVANIACILLAVRIGRHVVPTSRDDFLDIVASRALSLLVSLFVVTGYPFMFSLERGNYDILAMLFSLSMLWMLIEKPKSIWWPVIAISIAGHLKIYPLLLVLLIFAVHRFRCIIPLMVVNTLLLFCLGYSNAMRFFEQIRAGFQKHYLWIGNHSAISFNKMVLDPSGYASGATELSCILIPIAIMIAGLAVLVRRGFSNRGFVLAFVLLVPVMHLLSGTSHDYKLVILFPAAAMILYLILHDYAESGRFPLLLFLGVIMLVMGFLGRSYKVTASLWLQNKYPYILMFQLLIFLLIVFYYKPYQQQSTNASD
jgi:hypothetical protein